MDSVNIFISYVRKSDQDIKFLRDLEKSLTILMRRGKIQFWSGSNNAVIADEESAILNNFSSAELFILLLSEDYLSSSYSQYELECLIYPKYKAKEAHIIPIHVNTCRWKSHDILKNLQILPRNGRAVNTTSQIGRRGQLLYDIVNEIEDIVDQLLNGEKALEGMPGLATVGKQRFKDNIARDWLVEDMDLRKTNSSARPSRRPDIPATNLSATRQPAPTLRRNEKQPVFAPLRPPMQTTPRSTRGGSKQKNQQELVNEGTIAFKPLPKNRRKTEKSTSKSFWSNVQSEYEVCFHKLLWLTIILIIFNMPILLLFNLPRVFIAVSALFLTLGIFNTNILLALFLATIYGVFWGEMFQIHFSWLISTSVIFGTCISLLHLLLFIKHPGWSSKHRKPKWWMLW